MQKARVQYTAAVRFLFVMDPFAGMLPDKDTTYAFMTASLARGHHILHCLPHELVYRGGQVFAMARQLTCPASGQPFQAITTQSVPLAALDAVFIRKDPPFDSAYLHLTQLLDLAKEHTLVLNDPQALRDANEKLFALHFADLMPPTMVSSDEATIIRYVEEVGGQAVIKPLDGAGGSGVAFLKLGDTNLRPLISITTREGARLCMVQEFQPSVVEGDKRVLLLDGQPLGAIRRVPQAGDIRANIHVGGKVVATDLSSEESALVKALGPRLAERGLWFVGLDVIQGKLIEVNVTSPTGIQELARLTGTDPASKVIDWVERRVPA